MRYRRLLAVLLIAHGLAHAGPGMWSASRGPEVLLAALWWVATIAFILAGCRVANWPAPRMHALTLTVVGSAASVVLLPFVGLGSVAVVGIALDVFLIGIVARATTAPVVPLGRPHPLRHRIAAAAWTLFLLFVSATILLRPWHTAWGTTLDDRRAPLPGDELVPGARYVMDHAVRINAPAGEVWAWLVQIGQDRGGFYSYDRIERAFGDDVHNADRIHPEWQRLAAGDFVRAAQPDYLGGRLGPALGWNVLRVDSARALVLENWGAFALRPIDSVTTLLQARLRGDGRPSLSAVPLAPIGLLLFEPAHFIMERSMLLGIKARAEGRVRPR